MVARSSPYSHFYAIYAYKLRRARFSHQEIAIIIQRNVKSIPIIIKRGKKLSKAPLAKREVKL